METGTGLTRGLIEVRERPVVYPQQTFLHCRRSSVVVTSSISATVKPRHGITWATL